MSAGSILKGIGMSLYLFDGRMKEAAYAYNSWSVVLDEGSNYGDVFRPEFWSHVAMKFRVGDLIQVRNDQNTLYAELYIRDCGRLFAKVEEIRKIEFEVSEAVAEDSPYYVKWASMHHKWSVFRRSDRERVKDGFETREGATLFMIDHAKSMAA